MKWNSVETMPENGEFLICVWEGDWEKLHKNWRVHHAEATNGELYWNDRYTYDIRSISQYLIAGWMPLPEQPK